MLKSRSDAYTRPNMRLQASTRLSKTPRHCWSVLAIPVNLLILLGFSGIPLDAQALLQVQYGETALENGQSLTAERKHRPQRTLLAPYDLSHAETSELPAISVVPGEEFAGNFNGSATFTLMLA